MFLTNYTFKNNTSDVILRRKYFKINLNISADSNVTLLKCVFS